MSETVDRWERVLDRLEENNLKLSAKKTSCFPDSLDLLGWSKQGAFLVPDPHRQNTLLSARKPKTIKDLRSFLGTFHTFYKCHQKQNIILAPLTKLLANKPAPGQKIVWTKELEDAFATAQASAKDLDQLYIPKQDDQLVLTSDYAAKGTDMTAGISATLWAKVKDEWKVITRMSAEIPPMMKDLDPCDGEAAATYVAGKMPAFSVPIKASTKKTLALVDSKPVSDAAKLLRNGKFSSSRLINYILACISELNMDFHHVSGKMKYNFPDDFGSRNPAPCNNNPKCKVHTFISECLTLDVSNVSVTASLPLNAIIGQITATDGELITNIISGKTQLPLTNRQAMAYLQDRDKDLVRVKELLRAGQKPSSKRDNKVVKVYFRSDVTTTLDKKGCIIVIKQNRSNLIKRDLVAVPNNTSLGILYSLHVNLDHPTMSQLHQAVDTRFFIQDLANKCKEITDSCTLCTSVEPIPDEIHQFSANTVPDHPGESFTIDIMRESKKLVLVAVDNFSAYMATTFVTSEKEEDLRDGIILAITPFMANSLSKVRVDRAPGFAKMSTQTKVMEQLGIALELGNAKNKNSLAIVDQKIKELRAALKRISPSSNVLNQTCLSRATTVVNEKIRHHRLSAKEIHFCRDSTSNKPIHLNDEEISDIIQKKREDDNASKLRKNTNKLAKGAEASQGQLVFVKSEGDKSSRRDLYLVLEQDSAKDSLTICKVRDALSQKPATISPQDNRYRYVVKQTDVVLAPNQPKITPCQAVEDEEDEEWEETEYDDNPAEQESNENTEENDELDDLWIPVLPQQQVEDVAHHIQEPPEYDDEIQEAGYEADEELQESEEGSSEEDGRIVQEPATNQEDDEVFIENEALAANSELPPEPAADPEVEEDLHNPVIEEPHAKQQPPRIMNQPRKPVCGDIISYCYDEDNNLWVTAKIRNKVQGYKTYYNVDLEDGGEDGLDLLLPTATDVGLWTLLDQEDWNPIRREQLLNLSDHIPSRQITPDTTISQVHSDTSHMGDEYYHQEEQLDLPLHPQQTLQKGQPHVIPGTWFHSKYSLDPSWNSNLLQDEKFVHRVEEVANELGDFPPNQQQLRIDMARLIVRGERFQKENSFFSKLKRVFNIS